MKNELHIVLGASGAIGQAVISELKFRNLKIRAVGRNKLLSGIEFLNADLLDLDQTINAVAGGSHVYLCIGITYNSKAWLEEWPNVMENVIIACEKARARLIFLDNVYMYGPLLKVPFDETHEQNPISQKGLARKKVADLLLRAHNTGRVRAVIGRSADFYGPNAINGSFYIAFLERMLKKKSPQYLGKTDIKHTYSYSYDNGRALVSLALDEGTFGQVWHLPVSEPITLEEIILKFNRILGTNYKVSIIPRYLLGAMGIFIPILREVKEMLYQIDNNYIMNCDKFMNRFPDFKLTSLDEGIKEMIKSFQKTSNAITNKTE